MEEWINRTLETPQLGFAVLAAVFLLGIISAVISCCNIAVIGALAGYAGSRDHFRRRDTIMTAVGFMFGSIAVMCVIGVVIGFTGQFVLEHFGRYSKAFAGFILVLFGLASLGLLPFKLPRLNQNDKRNTQGMLGAGLLGASLGGSSLACSLSCCSPVLLVALGVAGLQGAWVRSVLLMGVFAIGYCIPSVVLLFGISFGKWTLRANKATPAFKAIAGVIMLGAGFYFLATI